MSDHRAHAPTVKWSTRVPGENPGFSVERSLTLHTNIVCPQREPATQVKDACSDNCDTDSE